MREPIDTVQVNVRLVKTRWETILAALQVHRRSNPRATQAGFAEMLMLVGLEALERADEETAPYKAFSDVG